ncbi:hypothetical protein ACHAXT_009225 [Thalassiosira profunda]
MAMTPLAHRSGPPAASAGAAVPSAASARAPVAVTHPSVVSSSSFASSPPDVDCDRLPPGLGRPDSCGIATLLKASVIDAAGGLLSLGGGGSEDVVALPEATAVLPPPVTDSMGVATSNYLIAGDEGDGATDANTVESLKKRKRAVSAETEPKIKVVRKAKRTKKSAAGNYRICSVPGCPKQVQQGGVCCSHGAKTTRSSCSHNGCTNVSKRGGLCRRHGAFDLNTCDWKGCRNVAVHGNFCSVHTETCAKAGCHREATHNRERPKTKVKDGAGAENEAGKKTNGPSSSSTKNKRKRTMCKLPGCEKDARARKEGYCCAHFTQLVAGVERPVIKPKVAAARKTRGRICSVPGCPKQVQQGGLCCSHGAKCSRGVCNHNGCTNVAKRGGLCRRHGAFDLKTCARKGCKRVARQFEFLCESCSKEK